VRRCLFNETDLERDLEIVPRDYCDNADSVAGEHKISEYSSVTTKEMEAGRTVVNYDSKTDPRTVGDYQRSYESTGERAYVAVPLMREAMANPDVTVATVCGGSLALAMAGLLEGRHAVTHQLGMDVLEATGVNVVHARVVDDGDLVTAGGVTSGLDLALHLLQRSYGPRVALTIESLFDYERRGTVWA